MNDARREVECPFVAKSREGLLVARLKRRVVFPSHNRTAIDALFELVAINTYAQAASFILDYGVPLDDIDYKLREFYRWMDEDDPSDSFRDAAAYVASEPLANFDIVRNIPFGYESSPGRKSAARTFETPCVDPPSFFEETLCRDDISKFAKASIPSSWTDLRRSEANEIALRLLRANGFEKEAAGCRDRSAFRVEAEDAFYGIEGLRVDGRFDEKERSFEALIELLRRKLGAKAVESLLRDALVEERLLTVCEGISTSDLLICRDFFRALLCLMAVAEADIKDERAVLALDGLFRFWTDGDVPLVVFKFPGFENGGWFSPCFDEIDVATPFVNCGSLPSRKREAAVRSFRSHFAGDSKLIRSNGNLIAFPLEPGENFADKRSRAILERSYSTLIARFVLGLYRSNKLAIPSKGRRILSSGSMAEVQGRPLVVDLFEAACELDCARAERERDNGVRSPRQLRRVGLCVSCGHPAYPGSKYCFGDSCRARAYQSARHAGRRSDEGCV